jgi:hypothetical protein
MQFADPIAREARLKREREERLNALKHVPCWVRMVSNIAN